MRSRSKSARTLCCFDRVIEQDNILSYRGTGTKTASFAAQLDAVDGYPALGWIIEPHQQIGEMVLPAPESPRVQPVASAHLETDVSEYPVRCVLILERNLLNSVLS
jgi:hypothetical protein